MGITEERIVPTVLRCPRQHKEIRSTPMVSRTLAVDAQRYERQREMSLEIRTRDADDVPQTIKEKKEKKKKNGPRGNVTTR
ncbi:hypothetical protein X777_11018 [Ooceraea biroi]|uniref:Uncharacterized protein n=1 Tax=Ooceraea biroi TaxID=2015173 RepID=A0A026W3N2_OOCBI|nr:hypothetical protein X777_11018 [Ooceraea biroi]